MFAHLIHHSLLFQIDVQYMLRFLLKERIADKEFRERRRITLQEVSDETGLNRMTLSKIVNHHGANVRTDVIDKLCDYFDCPVEDIVQHVPQDPPASKAQ